VKDAELERVASTAGQSVSPDTVDSVGQGGAERLQRERKDLTEQFTHQREALEAERDLLVEQLSQQRERYEAEKTKMEMEQDAEVKALKDRLAQEELSMFQFKEDVRKQFEERQASVHGR